MSGIIKKGIDVSYAQNGIDWGKVKAAGVEFAIIRAGYGQLAQGRDKRLAENAAGCAENGIPFGFYHYSYAVTPEQAETEARTFLDSIRGYKPEYPVWMDLEERVQTSLDPERQMDIIAAFLTVLEMAGYHAGLYSFKSALERLREAQPQRLARYDVWSAQWNKSDGYGGAHGMWQYSASGTVPGISGPVDMDIAYRDYPALLRESGRNGLSPADAPSPASVPPQSPTAEVKLLRARCDALLEKLEKIKAIAES